MSPEVAAAIAALPPWVQVAINLMVGVASFGIAFKAWLSSRSKAPAPAEEHLEVEDILASSPIKTFLEAVTALSDNMRVQTDALKTIAAAATAHAKAIEDDFDELRIFRAVQEELDRRERERKRAG